MTDEANPFDKMGDAAEASPTPDTNPFDEMSDKIGAGADVAEGSSAKGAFARSAVRGVVPAAGGLVGAGYGAGLGAFGGPLDPITIPVGAVLGGLLGSYGAGRAQDYAMSQAPDSWLEKIGQDERQRELDDKLHPYASFLGGIAPYALTMKPSLSVAEKALPANASAFTRLMANPATAHVFGGAIAGGMELGNEKLAGESPDWTKVAISTGFGTVFNQPTKLGQRLTEFGERPFGPMSEAMKRAAHSAYGDELPEQLRPGYVDPDPVSIAAAGDAKIMGPGITEEVFNGAHEQHPDAAMAVQEQRRAELPMPEMDIHATARRMHPETFDLFDRLSAQRDALTAATMDPVAGEAARQHLAATNAEMAQLAPEISAAYRRAADIVGTESVEPPPRAVDQPAPFRSLADMIAARDAPTRAEMGEKAEIGGKAPAEVSALEAPNNSADNSAEIRRTSEQQRAAIAADQTQRLLAAGRPMQEATAAGNLIAARYMTRAARMGGALGSAEELYAREGAILRGPGAPAAPPALRSIVEHPPAAGEEPVLPGERQVEQWKQTSPFRTVDDLMAAAPANQDRLADVGHTIAEATGTRFVNPGIKKAEGVADKMTRKGYATAGQMTDVVRGGFGVDTPEKVDDVIAKLREHFDVADEGWRTMPAGYTDRKAIIRLPDGQLGEVQFWHPDLFDAKEYGGGHALYEEARALPDGDPRKVQLEEEMQRLYAGVLDRLPPSWKDFGSGGSTGNLASKSALLTTAADMPTSEELTGTQDPSRNAIADPGFQTQGSPSQTQNFIGQPSFDNLAPVSAAYEATDKLNALSPAEQMRELPKYSEEAEAGIPPKADDHPAGVFMFDPLALNVDASRFQFKSGGDQYGVTGALRNVSKWDPAKAQAIMVWEQADGKLFVADGHQRSGLARRLTEEGKAQPGEINLPGILYREKDGVSADDIRAIAAVTNIANGSGSALDGAKVLRARPDLMDGSLPLSVGKGGQAASLARLGDEAFRMVVNDVVPEHFGAVVGDLLPNDPDRQVAAMKAISRFEPRNAEEAAVLTQRVAQAELEKANEGAQASMFGDLETPESTAGEEMKIVGRAIKDLKKDRALFSRVVANAERIEETGSHIERGTAQSVASDAELFAKTLASSAYSKGPVRDALVAAAKDLKNGSVQVGEASARILAALRGAAEEDGADRAGNRGRDEEAPAAREYAQSEPVHIVTSVQNERPAIGVFKNIETAQQALNEQIMKIYKAYSEDNHFEGFKRVPIRTAMQRLEEHGVFLPKIHTVEIDHGGSIHVVHELVADPNDSWKDAVKIHHVGNDLAEARNIASEHAEAYWNDGHQAFRDELSSQEAFDLRKQWNAEHPDYKIDRDVDFVDEDVPEELKGELNRRFMEIMDSPPSYPGLRKANALQSEANWRSESAREGVFRVSRHSVEGDYEPGVEGKPQQLVPGVAPVTMRDKLMALAEKPMQGKRAQRDLQADGLFGDGSRQKTLFQRDQVETPEFKNWFGDSKIVDAKGKPQVLYHGTRSNISEFQPSRGGEFGPGVYLTNDPGTADFYASAVAQGEHGPSIVPVYAALKNPYEVSKTDWIKMTQRSTPRTLQARLKSQGYDGIIGVGLNGIDRQYIAFEPEQIKSAIANSGDFNPKDANILRQGARGSIRFRDGDPQPTIKLMETANASTFFHETGHQWLEELMRDSAHEAAPEDVRADAATVRDWLGIESHADLGEKTASGNLTARAVRAHEKFARGFEQYLREGVAPSPGLASVFAKFRDWLTSIYQTVSRLGAPINDDIRGVFDRMLSMDPQRTVIAGEREPTGPLLADIHEADARETEPHEAEPAMDRLLAERDRFIQEIPPEHAHEIAGAIAQVEASIAQEVAERGGGPAGAAERARQDGAGAGGRREVEQGGGDAGTVAGRGQLGAPSGQVERGGGAAGTEGDGLRGSEQRSGGAGRDNEHPLAPAAAPILDARESPFVDRAGNIRVENLTTNADVAQAIHDAADANNDFIGDRRGVVTDGQVMDLADALGMDVDKLNQRKIGQAFNAEQIVAARKLLIQSATQVSAAMKKAATGGEEDVLAYALAKDRHRLIQAQVSGITAETGRALRAFRSLAGQEEAAGVDQFIRQATGKTLFQLQEEARLGAQLDTPQKVSKFMQDSVQRSFGRGIVEYFVNNLISGPATHTTYMIGNAALLLEHLGVITPIAAGIGEVKARFGYENPNRIRFGEAAAGFRGLGRGIAPAIQAVGQAMKTGLTSELPGQTVQESLPLQFGAEGEAARVDMETRMRDLAPLAFGAIRGMRDGIVANAGLLAAGGVPNAPMVGPRYSPLGVIPDIAVRGVNVLPVGTLARAPGRMVAAIHSFFRVLNYSTDLNQQAWRQAASEGLDGPAFASRVADLRQNPTEQMMEAARLKANNLTLMGQAGDFMQKVSRVANFSADLPILGNTQPIKFIDPFVQIAGQVVKQSVTEQTPLGFFASKSVRDDLLGKNGGAAQDLAGAKMIVGSALGMTFMGLAAQGYASGSGPTDHGEAQSWRRQGNQPYSVRIGDTWYALHRLGPLGILLGLGADLHDIVHKGYDEGDVQKATAMFLHSFSQNFLDEGFMRGPADLMKAIEESDRYGTRYVGNFASSFVPWSTGMAQMTRAMDPYAWETRTAIDAIRAKVPGHLNSFFAEPLYPRRDVWGEPIPTLNALGGAGVTAIYESKVNNDPVEKALSDLSIYPAPLGHKFRGVDLTERQYDDYTRIAGRMTKQRLDTIVNSPDWQTFPNSSKVYLINEVRRQSREIAANTLMAKYPNLPTEAYALKVAKMNGQKKP